MKRLIAGLVAGLMLALPLSASAQGIGEDKYKHAGVAGVFVSEGVIWIVHKTW